MLIKELKRWAMLFLEMFNFYLATVCYYPKRKVNSLNVLTLEEREQFLSDMSILGDAIIHSWHTY